MNHKEITQQYYSKWLGQDNILNNPTGDVTFIYSPKRNEVQLGYVKPFDLYIVIQPHRILVSYGDKMKGKITDIENRIPGLLSAEEVKRNLTPLFTHTIKHNIKYVYDTCRDIELKSRPLTASEYPKYLEFFKKTHPECLNVDWVEDYFAEMVSQNVCCGLYEGDFLACCSDAPDMPYMPELVQEIGINTLSKYRGKGYAADVCLSCAKEIMKNGKVPQWSTTIDNIASQKLAGKIGFVKFADVLTVTVL